MKTAIDETNRRRTKQEQYNAKHGIVPQSVHKAVRDIIDGATSEATQLVGKSKQKGAGLPMPDDPKQLAKMMSDLVKDMYAHAENLEFELAARARDQIEELRSEYLRS